MADEHRQTQEQSIKARKHQIFDDVVPAVSSGSSKPFKEFLRETPAAPLSGGMKAALWAVGAVVALLLVAALMKGMGGAKGGPKPAGKSASAPSEGPGRRPAAIS